MKVCLYTIDMYSGTERLMPWRTLVEVARYMCRSGHMQAIVCSAQDDKLGARVYDGVTIHAIPKGISHLLTYIKENQVDLLYYPVAFRDTFKPLSLLEEIKCVKIAYIPGGIYPLKGIISLGCLAGLKSVKPYLLEKLIPHSLLLSKLKKAGFEQIISFSKVTQQNVIRNGWPISDALLAIPGLDDFHRLESDYSCVKNLGICDNRFILFSGAPATIRGSITLLRAFDRFAEENDTAYLVMLMRRDLSSDFGFFKESLEKMKYRDRVVVSYEKLSASQLKAFFETAYIVALPFLLVPSEIPLTFFEVLSCGTPIITFDNCGTSDYIKGTSVNVSERTPEALAAGLSMVFKSQQYRDNLSSQAMKLMEIHPSWEEFAQKWIERIKTK